MAKLDSELQVQLRLAKLAQPESLSEWTVGERDSLRADSSSWLARRPGESPAPGSVGPDRGGAARRLTRATDIFGRTVRLA